MHKNHFIISVLLSILISACSNLKNEDPAEKESLDLTDYVNPFIGTDAHGHTYPGATYPFGMVQLSPDTRLEGWDGCSGYHYSDSVVFGFSHTHLSGTGVPDYCDILFMPTVGPVQLENGADKPDNGYASRFSHQNEEATAGYYKTYLDDYGIAVELTVTKRAGFHKYVFPEGNESNIIIDLEHRDKVIDSYINIVNESEVEGYRISNAWASNQLVYFVGRFSKPMTEFGITESGRKVNEDSIKGKDIKAFLRFETTKDKPVLVKVGISAVSLNGARKNLDAEIPGWDFDRIRKETTDEWNRELGKIIVSGGSEAQKTTFYTALYHAFLVPNLFMDVDGRYRGMDIGNHKADGFEYFTVFSLWDTFRGAHPLYTITQEKRTVDFIKTMIMQFEQGGRLPVWELAANETECMIGYHSIPVIADAYMKGIRNFDVEKAFEAMKHSATLDHFGLQSYKENGFIPAEDEAESVSKTLEYAYDDWCIAMMARDLGKMDDYKYFIERAQYYKNLYDPSTGFMRAKMNGRWFEPFNPKEVNFNYTEANSWQYSFFVPQDISGLMEIMGGEEKFIERLDNLFEESSETTGRQQSDITGLIGQYAHGNEPSHHMAYLYNYAGQPWKTQQRVRQIMDELYTDQPDGLCGNEDCGQMSAWYVLSALGFYPVTPTDPIYAIGSPLFDEVRINLENGNTFTIKSKNNSKENLYIQSAQLKGKEYRKSFIQHADIMSGGELVFEMGPKPNKNWIEDDKGRPVSEISEELILPVPYVKSGGRTFTDTAVILLESITEGSEIYYTLDGSEPNINSLKYSQPFVLDASTAIKAIAVKEGYPQSKTLDVEFYKIPIGREIRLNTNYENQYSAGGDLALIDFIRGPLNFRTGAWQGYEGVDLDAVVDLGSIQLINNIEIGFLQDIGSWIFMPTEVQFFISNDGAEFQHIGTVKNDISHKMLGTNIKNFKLNFAAKTRFVRVVAKNIGVCPEWHVGDGRPAWIFADEIMIK